MHTKGIFPWQRSDANFEEVLAAAAAASSDSDEENSDGSEWEESSQNSELDDSKSFDGIMLTLSILHTFSIACFAYYLQPFKYLVQISSFNGPKQYWLSL